MDVALFFFVQSELFSFGILKLFNSLCVGSPRKPAGRPVHFLVTADLAMVLVFGTGILLRLVITLRFSKGLHIVVL